MTTTYAGHAGCAAAPSSNPRPSANDLTLIALHTAIGLSGLFARFTAHQWGFRYLSHAAERVAAELIARAVETTGNPDPNPRYTDLGELHIIGIRVSRQGNCLLIEVWDSDPTPPQDAYPDNHLSLVAEISHQWSYYRPRSGGKVIRAELHRPEQRQVGEQLPHRTAGGSYSYSEPETPAEPLRDVAVMRRVLDGLHQL
jgi:hypothetical protein